VTGTLKLASPADRGEPPERGAGFTERVRNPLKPPRPADPLPYIIVVLDGGTPADEDTKPPGRPAVYRVVGESFDVPVLPVVNGSAVEIVNDGKNAPRLYSPSDDQILDGESIAPRKKRTIKNFGPAFQVLELRDHDSVHLSGTLVAMPHAYFSRVTEEGRFEITGVPAGTWRIRLWYRTGWVELPEILVNVGKKPVDQSVDLPAKLKTAPAKGN
jgi:hypothetical protein